jgi:hypothetical protein
MLVKVYKGNKALLFKKGEHGFPLVTDLLHHAPTRVIGGPLIQSLLKV